MSLQQLCVAKMISTKWEQERSILRLDWVLFKQNVFIKISKLVDSGLRKEVGALPLKKIEKGRELMYIQFPTRES